MKENIRYINTYITSCLPHYWGSRLYMYFSKSIPAYYIKHLLEYIVKINTNFLMKTIVFRLHLALHLINLSTRHTIFNNEAFIFNSRT